MFQAGLTVSLNRRFLHVHKVNSKSKSPQEFQGETHKNELILLTLIIIKSNKRQIQKTDFSLSKKQIKQSNHENRLEKTFGKELGFAKFCSKA